MEEAGMRKSPGGTSGLGTSSKLLDPGAKGMWGGGMARHPSSPVVTAFWEVGRAWLKLIKINLLVKKVL
jgi:hypothetical protein